MDNDHTITDELREWWIRKFPVMDKKLHEDFTAIADRIDAEHQKQMAERRRSCVFYDAERNYCKVHDEGDMAELGYVRLPVDADGVPIRVGDVLNPPADCDDYMPLLVVRLIYDGYDEEWFFDGEAGGFCGMVGEHMDVAGWTHHRSPTVEDLLCELLDKVDDDRAGQAEIIAEYAKRLRLAGDAE